jgi:hypothetical protein
MLINRAPTPGSAGRGAIYKPVFSMYNVLGYTTLVVPVKIKLSLDAQGMWLFAPIAALVTLNLPERAPLSFVLSICSICWLYVL